MALTKVLNQALGIKTIERIDYFDTRYYKIRYKEGKDLKEAFFPSVTEILQAHRKPGLELWRGTVGNQQADEIIEQAFRLGSGVHYGAEQLLKGASLVYNPYHNPLYTEAEIKKLKQKNIIQVRYLNDYIQLFRIYQLFQELKPKNVDTEQTVYSLRHKYAGTLDLIMYLDEGTYDIAGAKPLYLEAGYYIGDYKTGKQVSKDYYMQIAAYISAVAEGNDILSKEIKGGLIFHTNSTTENGVEGIMTHYIKRADVAKYLGNFLKIYEVYKIDKPVPTPKDFKIPGVLTLDKRCPATERSGKPTRRK